MLPSIPDSALYAGQALAFTVTATDAESPPQIITYSLDTALAGANINSTNGLFTWTPMPAQAGTNSVTVRASDNGTPSLSATRAFNIFVRLPPASTIILSNGVIALSFDTIPGKTYRVDYKNDLNDASWLPLAPGEQQAAGSTLRVTDDIGVRPQRFYRIVVTN